MTYQIANEYFEKFDFFGYDHSTVPSDDSSFLITLDDDKANRQFKQFVKTFNISVKKVSDKSWFQALDRLSSNQESGALR